MRIEDPGLWQLKLFVPDYRLVRARLHDVFPAPRLVRVDDDDAVGALANRIAAHPHARRVVAVVAHDRQIRSLDHMRVALNTAQDAHGTLGVGCGGRGVTGKVVADVFVPRGNDAILAVLATPDFDNQIPLAHSILLTPHGRAG